MEWTITQPGQVLSSTAAVQKHTLSQDTVCDSKKLTFCFFLTIAIVIIYKSFYYEIVSIVIKNKIITIVKPLQL